MNLYNDYCRDFHIQYDDIANVARVLLLVEIAIKMTRCNKLEAIYPHMIITTEDKNGRTHRKLNPIAKFHLMLFTEHSRVLREFLAAVAR
jgi:hypothetical protein